MVRHIFISQHFPNTDSHTNQVPSGQMSKLTAYVFITSIGPGAGFTDTLTIPNLSDLTMALCNRLADKWKRLGVYLRLPKAALDTINRENSEDCLVEMLDCWLKQVNPPPSWTTIIEAIEVLGDKQLAAELKTKYCTGSQ